MTATMSAKSALRSQMKLIIKSISDEERKRQSALVMEKVLQLPVYLNAKRVSVYLSLRSEIDTSAIVEHCFETGKELFIPRYFTKPKGESNTGQHAPRMDMVKLNGPEDLASLPTTSWNIKQPGDKEAREEALETGGLDVILVPGLAFTLSGKRCGKGGGFYDTYLARCIAAGHSGSMPGTRKPVTVGLAFAQQIVDDLPVTEDDFTIDYVIAP